MPKFFQNKMSALLTNQDFEIKIVELSFLLKIFLSKTSMLEIVLENTLTLI